MTDKEKLEQFAQEVYLTMFGRKIDDIEDTDGEEEIEKTIIWANLFKDELEREADWNWLRETNKEIATISTPTQVINLPEGVRKLPFDEHRPLAIMQGDSIVSLWDLVEPSQIARRNEELRSKRATVVNGKVIFSREFDDTEIGGKIVADAINEMPELTPENVELIDLVQPRQLLVLGVVKNATLPDIVQGGLSPSFIQRYADLLEQAKRENDESSVSDDVVRDNYSYIGGVY